ncbi:MAG: SBBP repeat-containing protein, partial [Blastococcus sp.]|nr:SBBP repeat-containing protein [Blastococcus sp.]
MSPRPTSAPTAVHTLTVVGTVAVLALSSVVLGQRLLSGAEARTSQAPLGPVALTSSTFLGGLEWDEAFDVEVDDAGNRYLAGFTLSRDFPEARVEGPGGIVDAFVVKVSAEGALVWSVVLGGTDLDTATGIALDDAGNAYVTGRTGSVDFPSTDALQPEINGAACNGAPCHDAYVTKLNPDGAIIYSTYLGGSLNEEALGIAVADDGSAIVSGNTDSRDLPTVAAFQAEFGSPPCPGDLPCELDVFVSKLAPDGGSLTYSTYLGGGASDTNAGVAVADDGTAFVAGTTRSPDFPVVGGVQGGLNGTACGPPPGAPCLDAFVTALAPDGSAAEYSTYLGGTQNETAGGVAVDSTGRAVVTGYTQSPDFPTARPVQGTLSNTSCTREQPEELCDDGFVTRLSPDGGSLDFSTFLGGTAEDQGLGVAVDDAGNIAVAGRTDSRDFPIRDAVQPAFGGYIDGFVTLLAAADGALVWS